MNIRNFTINGFVSKPPELVKKGDLDILTLNISQADKLEDGQTKWFNFQVKAFNEKALELFESVGHRTAITVEGTLQPWYSEGKSGMYMNIKTYKVAQKRVPTNAAPADMSDHAAWIAEYDATPDLPH